MAVVPLTARLPDEQALDLLVNAELFKYGHRRREERLTDVKSGECLFLEKSNLQALPRRQRCDCRSRRTATDDDDIDVVGTWSHARLTRNQNALRFIGRSGVLR